MKDKGIEYASVFEIIGRFHDFLQVLNIYLGMQTRAQRKGIAVKSLAQLLHAVSSVTHLAEEKNLASE